MGWQRWIFSWTATCTDSQAQPMMRQFREGRGAVGDNGYRFNSLTLGRYAPPFGGIGQLACS
jgi:hypothetical protein